MHTTTDERLLSLEDQAMRTQERLARLEHRAAARPDAAWAAPAAPERPAVAPRPAPAVRAVLPPAPVPARPRLDLEDVLGGRVLAWTGGLAVALGVAFLLAMAVSQGWIGETSRVALAGAGGLVLLGAGIWLRERRGQADAALAACGAGIAVLFAAIAVGGPGYGILPAGLALVLAMACGAVATTLAVRWQARGIAALGIGGALLSPVIAGAPPEATTMALLWIAGAAGAAVLIRQRWDAFAVAVFALTAPQWLWWLFDDASLAGALAALIAFGMLNAALAVGFELADPSERLRASAAFLLTAGAIVLASAGALALDEHGPEWLAHAWLAGLAGAHAVAGLATARTSLQRDLRLLCLALGVVLADVTAGVVLDGPALALVWAAGAGALGVMARRVLGHAPDDANDERVLALGLGGHLLLASVQALLQAPPEAAAAGTTIDVAGHAAVACVAAAAFVAARFTDVVRPSWRRTLDVVALVGLGYETVMSLDGPVLAVALAAECATLAAIALRRRDAVAAWGAAAFAGAAITHAVALDAPLDALVSGLADPAGGGLAVGAVTAAALWIAMRIRGEDARVVTAAAITAALGALYLASTQLVTLLVTGDRVTGEQLLHVGPDQLAQAALSGLWAVTGLTVLVVGLRRDARRLRMGALALLLTTVGKVFVFDLATLDSIYRVVSFVALGVLLLMAAAAWQRVRPAALPDLRAAPDALR